MGTTSAWGKTVIAARDKPVEPMTIDGVFWKDWMRGQRSENSKPSPGERSMSDPMEILLSRDRSKKQMLALSGGLRRKKEIAQLAMLSGSRDVVRFGQGMYDNVQDKFNTRMKEKDREDLQDFAQNRYKVLSRQFDITADRADRTLEETIKHHRAMEKSSALAATMARFRNPPATAVKKTNQTISAVVNIKGMAESFKDEYANTSGIPWEGSFSNMMGDTPMGTEGQQEQVNWWKKYRQMYELGTRNELFGSALTAQEIAAWEAANISPDSPPEQIKAGLEIMRQVALQKAMQQHISDQELYLPQWVDSVYAPLMDMELGGAGAGGNDIQYPQAGDPSLPQSGGVTDLEDLPSGR